MQYTILSILLLAFTTLFTSTFALYVPNTDIAALRLRDVEANPNVLSDADLKRPMILSSSISRQRQMSSMSATGMTKPY